MSPCGLTTPGIGTKPVTGAGWIPGWLTGTHPGDALGRVEERGGILVLDDDAILRTAHECVDAIRSALERLDNWGPSGTRPDQYRCDVVADATAVEVLSAAGLRVWSEESGVHGDGALTAVVDPIDGSTNAAARIPYYATSIAVLDDVGPRVAVVANLAADVRYEAVRSGGARRNGERLSVATDVSMADAIVGINGWAGVHLGWRQYRALGSAALELCALADGGLDGYLDLSGDGLAPWDYLGALLVCREAGVVVEDMAERSVDAVGPGDRRRIVASASRPLMAQLRAGYQRVAEQGG